MKRRRMKLDPFNQLFLTLMKLPGWRTGLAFQSGVYPSINFITWVRFVHTFKEITWMPSTEQVQAALPHLTSQEKYPDIFTIVVKYSLKNLANYTWRDCKSQLNYCWNPHLMEQLCIFHPCM